MVGDFFLNLTVSEFTTTQESAKNDELSFSEASYTLFIVPPLVTIIWITVATIKKLWTCRPIKTDTKDPFLQARVIHPNILFFFRIIAFLWHLVIYILEIHNSKDAEPIDETTFTNWNHFLLILYFLGMIIYTLIFDCCHINDSNNRCQFIFKIIIWIIYQILISSVLIVGITYYILVPFEDDFTPLEFTSINRHAIAIITLYIDVVFNNIIMKWVYFIFSIIWLTVYIYINWLWYAYMDNSDWNYFFLDPSSNINVLIMYGIVLLTFIFHIIAWSILRTKDQGCCYCCKSCDCNDCYKLEDDKIRYIEECEGIELVPNNVDYVE